MLVRVIQVAVIIPVFNGADVVGRAIESALAQRFNGDFELIVIDDGSTDATAEVLKQYAARVRLVSQPNRGPAAARNAAVAHSRAEFIAFLDADDAFLPEKLAGTVPILAAKPAAAMLFHDAVTLDVEGHDVPHPYIWRVTPHAPSLHEMLTDWWPILPSTVIMRRSAFEACGGFSEAYRSPGFEDPDLWIRAREQGEFIYMPDQLTYYTLVEARTERIRKYLPGQDLFFSRMRQRYGQRVEGLIRKTVRNYTNWLGYQGLLAMRAGDRVMARHYFALILRRHPMHIKSALRFVRTFLPSPLARALSGRTASARAIAEADGPSQPGRTLAD
jgi:glycosyltransferase involved in cell wall biosynthesis